MNNLVLPDTDLYTGFAAMNTQRRAFQNWKTTALSSYLEYEKRRPKEDMLISFNGCSRELQKKSHLRQHRQLLPHLLQAEAAAYLQSGGYWACLQGSAIVLNPGKDFLESFHEHGLHIWDIDYVVVTDPQEAASLDLLRIHSLNKEVNSLLKQWNLPTHIIRYFLHRDAFSQFSRHLQPSCREEKSLTEVLTTFGDHTTIESLALNENLTLEYASMGSSHDPVMLKFLSKNQPILGFVKGHCGRHQGPFLENCPTLLAGAGKIEIQKSTDEGITGLLSAVQSSLILVSEIDFSEGDMRLEAILALRQYLATKELTILPCEIGLSVHLENQTIQAPGLLQPTSASTLRVARTLGDFSPLQYFQTGSLL